jgi:3'-phosphoadenosine 5'-phosphosulfate (PAPS) 3'-phosphatase
VSTLDAIIPLATRHAIMVAQVEAGKLAHSLQSKARYSFELKEDGSTLTAGDKAVDTFLHEKKGPR